MKILIIDDEKGILDMYQAYFTDKKNEVITAINGEQGIDVAKDQKPDVILLDIIMPRLNGLDVLKRLKEDQDLKNIPVYLLTNLPEECSSSKAKEIGAAGYLVKAENEPKDVLEAISQENK